MSLGQFIRKNRDEIDQVIRQRCANLGTLNDNDRRQWILNEESLYRWARQAGCKI